MRASRSGGNIDEMSHLPGRGAHSDRAPKHRDRLLPLLPSMARCLAGSRRTRQAAGTRSAKLSRSLGPWLSVISKKRHRRLSIRGKIWCKSTNILPLRTASDAGGWAIRDATLPAEAANVASGYCMTASDRERINQGPSWSGICAQNR